MGMGKLIVQACHASVEAAEQAKKMNLDLWKRWIGEGARKVAVKVFSQEELLMLEKKCRSFQLPVALIIDRGLTQIPPNTPTAIAIGPAMEGDVDRLTGNLRLF
jgi:PTH2 family peptidyl-tRNA hydrolase